ncbi:copper homeostasis protein CutC [Goodfellowiella coeruleoviolacea]|uniref:PF03932 family protein CutC n=1 Tax=Goodfellowiella coeruleoviolacea TaxID=334858 RepID=A0AAE3KFJ3_9PSEU|nr:copper homeostasis protein CutC [Goodfellowiella coeruleoviolacea]MCP2165020.1 copper homeostasis protein [Goodfellowiella coeruleoviolacea]
MIRLELSVDTLAGAVAADALGADRVELCAAAVDGGLTPSRGVVARAVRGCHRAEVHVLIRPRGGDFTYTGDEVAAMVADIADAVEAGAAGVVTGALDAAGRVDRAVLRELVAAARGRPVTFHRAIDVSADPLAALAEVADLGVARVLTSGAATTAEAGAALIAEMVRQAPPGVAIMACGGIRPHNARAVLAATGVRDLHAAPRRPVRSAALGADRAGAVGQPGTVGQPGAVGQPGGAGQRVSFASGNPPAGYDRYELDEQAARELRAITAGPFRGTPVDGTPVAGAPFDPAG